MFFYSAWSRVTHYFEIRTARSQMQSLARSDAALDNPQRENALALVAPQRTTLASAAELRTQRSVLAAEMEEREQPVREHAKRLPSGVILAIKTALAMLAGAVEFRAGTWTAQGISDDPTTIFLFGLLLASGIVMNVHLLMRAIRMSYDGTDDRRRHIIGWTSLLTVLLLAASVLRLHDLHTHDGMTQAATVVLILLCSAAPAFLLDWLLRDIMPGMDAWRQWRRTAAPLRIARRDQEEQLRQLEDGTRHAELREHDRAYLAQLYDRTYERERRRRLRNNGA